ncbi:MAG: 1-acyl-sn-glycerol-3-phosphate acyltransferase [Spirochaetales bacterium]|nr:1-acyl-sn-glycerol-3-phosphate acyltransferase [Spirochaetales bacterium]
MGPAEVLRSSFRLAATVVALGLIVAATSVASLAFNPGGVSTSAVRHRRRCYALVLASLGIRLRSQVQPRDKAVLYVGNHPSWLDGLAVGALTGVSSVAYERGWPVIDHLMRSFGTVMVARGSTSGLPAAVDGVSTRLKAGGSVVVFPEGDTSFGPGVLPFRPAFFQSAVDARAAVTALAVSYRTQPPYPSPDRSIHWVDWTPFLVHAARIAGMRGVEARVEEAGAIVPDRSRKELATSAERLVTERLSRLQKETRRY